MAVTSTAGPTGPRAVRSDPSAYLVGQILRSRLERDQTRRRNDVSHLPSLAEGQAVSVELTSQLDR